MYIIYDKNGDVLTICSNKKSVFLFLKNQVEPVTVEKVLNLPIELVENLMR